MTKDEVLKQALEALEEACELIGPAWAWRNEKGRTSITAIKQALAAPVQEHQINQLEKFKNHVLANANALGVVLDSPAAQRQWVGLTAHDRMMCRSYDVDEAIAKTEAKLKELNT